MAFVGRFILELLATVTIFVLLLKFTPLYDTMQGSFLETVVTQSDVVVQGALDAIKSAFSQRFSGSLVPSSLSGQPGQNLIQAGQNLVQSGSTGTTIFSGSSMQQGTNVSVGSFSSSQPVRGSEPYSGVITDGNNTTSVPQTSTNSPNQTMPRVPNIGVKQPQSLPPTSSVTSSALPPTAPTGPSSTVASFSPVSSDTSAESPAATDSPLGSPQPDNELPSSSSIEPTGASNSPISPNDGTLSPDPSLPSQPSIDQNGITLVGGGGQANCSVPWSNDSLTDGQRIVAYKTRFADADNICEGEIRSCLNGQLQGGYQFPVCTYTIDGVNDGQDVIAGASNTKHNLFTYTKDSEVSREFRQGIRKSQPDTKIFDERGLLVDRFEKRGTTIVSTGEYTAGAYDVFDYFGGSGSFGGANGRLSGSKNSFGRNCVSALYGSGGLLQSGIVHHGGFVYAYRDEVVDARGSCLFEQRVCLDGKLRGGYQYSSCRVIPDVFVQGVGSTGSGGGQKPVYILPPYQGNTIANEALYPFQVRDPAIIMSGDSSGVIPGSPVSAGASSGANIPRYGQEKTCLMPKVSLSVGEWTRYCTSSICDTYRVQGSIQLGQKISFVMRYRLVLTLPGSGEKVFEGTLVPGASKISLAFQTTPENSFSEKYRGKLSFSTILACSATRSWEGYREWGYGTLLCRDYRDTRGNNGQVCCNKGNTLQFGKTYLGTNILDTREPIVCVE